MTSREATAERIQARLMLGLRVAVATIALVVLLTASLFRKLSLHHPLWPQLLAHATITAIVLAEVALTAGNRTWGRARGPALVAALAASALAQWSLPPEFATTSADWSFGTIGWAGVLLLLDRRPAYLITFLGLHALIVLGRLLVLGPHDRDTLLAFVAKSVGTLGLPLAAGLGAMVVASLARDAARAAVDAERLRTAEAVAERLHHHREQRLAEVFRTCEPLLEGLADGSLDPGREQVQRACSVEAARLRRMLAEADTTPDPLLHELSHCADVAQRRGIVVDLDVRGTPVSPPLAVRRALTEAPLAALSTARTWARVTVLAGSDALSVSVVADCGDLHVPESEDSGVRTTTLHEGELVWVETTWPVPQ